MTVKPGYTTTEFLVTVLTGLGSVLAAWQGSLSPKWAAVATAVSVAAYALSRAITKHGALTGPTTPVTVVASQTEPVVPVVPVKPV